MQEKTKKRFASLPKLKLGISRSPYPIERVRIKKNATFYYDLIFIVRETQGGNPWLKEIQKYANEIEKLDAKDVQEMTNVLQGRQQVLF